MILYFSATGNSKYVAERIAKETGDETLSITEAIKQNKYTFVNSITGIVSPTYDWGLPSIVKEYLEKVSLYAPYIYFVATYGTTPGQTGYMANKAIKNAEINAYYSVKMPDTWTPVFDLSTSEKVAKFTDTTELEINLIISRIQGREAGDFMEHKAPLPAALAFYPFYEINRKTKHFTVDDTCISCGMCQRKCPVNAIEMQNGKPVWVKDKCVLCLDCLHRCPKFAIQYKNKTRKHGQYTNPNTKV